MGKNHLLTYVTIATHRSYLLPHVYETLLAQTRYRFEWLILDADLQEHTRLMVSEWSRTTSQFAVRLAECRTENRSCALQMALDVARGDYFCLVEPEELLLEEATADLMDWIDSIDALPAMLGVSGAKCYLDGSPLYKKEPKIGIRGYVDASSLSRQKYGLELQRLEAYKTEILRRYPMSRCPGDEDTPWQITLDALAMQGYCMRWYTTPLCRGEYLSGSRTTYERRQERRNPMGYAILYNHRLGCREQSFTDRFDAACRHVALSIYAHHPEYIWKSSDKKLSLLAFLPGVLLAIGQSRPFG